THQCSLEVLPGNREDSRVSHSRRAVQPDTERLRESLELGEVISPLYGLLPLMELTYEVADRGQSSLRADNGEANGVGCGELNPPAGGAEVEKSDEWMNAGIFATLRVKREPWLREQGIVGQAVFRRSHSSRPRERGNRIDFKLHIRVDAAREQHPDRVST